MSCSTLKSLASEASQWRSSATRTVRSSISISHLRFRLSFRDLEGIANDPRQRMRQNKKRLSLAPVLLEANRQIERAAEAESVPAHARGIRQGHVGEALEQHGQQDDTNGSPRQVRARAMMRAVAKGLVRIGLAQPVVVLAIFEGILGWPTPGSSSRCRP